jgi:chromosome segregation ATPase
VIEQTIARNSELELLHESLARDSESRLQETISNFNNRDSEAKYLFEKLKIHEDQVKIYEEQVGAAVGKSASSKEELDETLLKLASLESINEELRGQILIAGNKASQSFSENELLVETNIQLKSKIDELQELLNYALSEEEDTSQQLVSDKNTGAELTDQHSRASELQSAAQDCIAQAERQLQEGIHRFTHRDSDAKDLIEKLSTLESQIKLNEEQAQDACTTAEAREIDLEQTLSKLKHLESIVEELQTKSSDFEKESGGLAEANMKLTQEVAMYEFKLSSLQAKLSAALAEKDKTVEELNSSENAIEDLAHQLASGGQKLQSRVLRIFFLYTLVNNDMDISLPHDVLNMF